MLCGIKIPSLIACCLNCRYLVTTHNFHLTIDQKNRDTFYYYHYFFLKGEGRSCYFKGIIILRYLLAATIIAAHVSLHVYPTGGKRD